MRYPTSVHFGSRVGCAFESHNFEVAIKRHLCSWCILLMPGRWQGPQGQCATFRALIPLMKNMESESAQVSTGERCTERQMAKGWPKILVHAATAAASLAHGDCDIQEAGNFNAGRPVQCIPDTVPTEEMSIAASSGTAGSLAKNG